MCSIPTEVLQSIPVPVLFYPSAGNDVASPVHVFAPHVTEFWFADFAYSQATLATPVLAGKPAFEFVDAVIGPARVAANQIADRYYRDEPPFVQTEMYLHTSSGKTITVHRTRRRGPSALRTELQRIGVFFYRGDGGEGGTGAHWLTVSRRKTLKKGIQPLFYEVLEKLPHLGLVATDGSGCSWRNNPYLPFATCADAFRAGRLQDVEDVPPFTDWLGNTFTCVGHAGLRHRSHTLLWQVRKPKDK